MQYLHLFVKMPGIVLLVGAVGTVRVVNSKKFLSRRTERKSKQNVGDESVLRTKLPFIVFIFLAPLSFCVKLHQVKRRVYSLHFLCLKIVQMPLSAAVSSPATPLSRGF